MRRPPKLGATAYAVGLAVATFASVAVAMSRAHVPPYISDVHHESLPESELSTHEDGGAPYGGWVASLAVSPGASTTVFASMMDGGVYRSDDFGASWTSTGRGLPVWTSCELTADPNQAATVYAACYIGGLFKTVDRGRTWQQLDVEEAQRATVAPSDSRVVYEPPDGGTMLRSLDAGRSWSEVAVSGPDARTGQFAVHPENPFVLFGGSGARVYRSRDGGRRWASISRGLDSAIEIKALAISPTDPDTIYVGSDTGVYRTTDGGKLWLPMGAVPAESYRWHLEVLPSSSETIDVHIGDEVFRSDDGGTHWQSLTETLHGDVQAFVVNPNNRARFMAGTRAGIFVSLDEGKSWTPASSGLGRATVGLTVHGTPPRVVASLGDGQFARLEGTEWKTIDDPGAFDSGPPKPTADPLRKSFETRVGLTPTFVSVAPSDASVAYAGTGGLLQPKQVFRTTDSGRTWTFMVRCSESIMHVACRPVFDPADPETVYVLVEDNGIDEVMRTTDGGKTWQPLDIRSGSSLFEVVGGDVTRLFTQLPRDGELHFVTSTDRGAHWTIIGQGLPSGLIGHLIVMPTRPQEMYVSIERRGVFRSTNGGRSWIATR